MTRQEAQAEAEKRWSGVGQPEVFQYDTDCRVGYLDDRTGRFVLCGIGNTFAAAYIDADARSSR